MAEFTFETDEMEREWIVVDWLRRGYYRYSTAVDCYKVWLPGDYEESGCFMDEEEAKHWLIEKSKSVRLSTERR